MSIIIAVFAITILYLYLIAPRMFRKPNRSVLSGTHYAHRGLFDNETDAPENSIGNRNLHFICDNKREQIRL